MIKFNDLGAQWKVIKKQITPTLFDLLEHGPYILGNNLEKFEHSFSEYNKVEFAVGVSNGSDALRLALQAVSLNSTTKLPVILPSNCHISDALAPYHLGHRIVFIDCDEYYGMSVSHLAKWMKENGSPKSIIIPVHLYGHPSNVPAIKSVAPNSVIINDCSQAHGALIEGKPIPCYGNVSIFSLYPTKNLGAMGDAGIIVTDNKRISKNLKLLRDYGYSDRKNCTVPGWNNRLDEIQALILQHKLKYLDEWNTKRKALALLYNESLKGFVKTPKTAEYTNSSVYHLYVVRVKRRAAVQKHLSSLNIPTMVHYPLPVYKMRLFKNWGTHYPNTDKYSKEILSLPMHPFLKKSEVLEIAKNINSFLE